MALRKYFSVQSNFFERTLINIASGKSNRLRCLQGKHYNQYLCQVLSAAASAVKVSGALQH